MAKKIWIKATSVRYINSKVPSYKSKITVAKNGVNSVRNNVQPDVAARYNNRANLNSIYSDLSIIERNIHDLYTTINQCVDVYVNADDSVKRMARNVKDWKK
ncbi:MAG: hypothetical protein ACI4HZ_03295 [Ruminococcus sp.]